MFCYGTFYVVNACSCNSPWQYFGLKSRTAFWIWESACRWCLRSFVQYLIWHSNLLIFLHVSFFCRDGGVLSNYLSKHVLLCIEHSTIHRKLLICICVSLKQNSGWIQGLKLGNSSWFRERFLQFGRQYSILHCHVIIFKI